MTRSLSITTIHPPCSAIIEQREHGQPPSRTEPSHSKNTYLLILFISCLKNPVFSLYNTTSLNVTDSRKAMMDTALVNMLIKHPAILHFGRCGIQEAHACFGSKLCCPK